MFPIPWGTKAIKEGQNFLPEKSLDLSNFYETILTKKGVFPLMRQHRQKFVKILLLIFFIFFYIIISIILDIYKNKMFRSGYFFISLYR